MKRPSGDHVAWNSGQGDRVSRLSPVPSALMDQTAWKLSKAIRPESEVRSMAREPSVGSGDGSRDGDGGSFGEMEPGAVAEGGVEPGLFGEQVVSTEAISEAASNGAMLFFM